MLVTRTNRANCVEIVAWIVADRLREIATENDAGRPDPSNSMTF